MLTRADPVNGLVNMRGGDLPCTPVNGVLRFITANRALPFG